MTNISCLILTKNEAETIGGCIDSLGSLEPKEIIVIDDDSRDETVSIAQYKKATVFTHQKKNFAEARNFAKTKARGEWLFYIDADEMMTPELAQEIKTLLINNPVWDGGRVNRTNNYLGKRWPTQEKMVRLFRKTKLKEWYGEIHESPIVSGAIYDLSGAIEHFTHRTLSEMVENTISWSGIEAKLRFANNHPPVSWWRIPRVMLPVFFDYYIKQGGWRMGTVGLIESMYQAFSMFITYARLWELQNKPAINNK